MSLSPATSRIAATLALLLGTGPTLLAQPMYKCGNTYSQTPCAPDAAAKRVYSGAAPAPAPGLSGYALCAAAAPKATGSPEPETARVRQIGERRAEIIQFAGQGTATHRYDLGVDAKTRYGVYSGEVAYACWVSEDQRRILQFSAAR